MSAGEERDREAHISGEVRRREVRKDTMKQDAGVLDLTVFTHTHTAEAILDLGGASASLPASVFFHKFDV